MMDITKIYYKKMATKAELRQALGIALGLSSSEAPSAQDPHSVFSHCRDFFTRSYSDKSGISYCFGAADGKALSSLLKKIEGLLENPCDSNIEMTFEAFISKLPQWYKDNAFTLVSINRNFNHIAQQIKNNKQNGNISNEYKQRILNDLLA